MPEFDQWLPVGCCIVGSVHPRTLFVLRKDKVTIVLSSNEALMIVARGIDQMSHHFCDRPAINTRAMTDNGFVQFKQPQPSCSGGGFQLCGGFQVLCSFRLAHVQSSKIILIKH